MEELLFYCIADGEYWSLKPQWVMQPKPPVFGLTLQHRRQGILVYEILRKMSFTLKCQWTVTTSWQKGDIRWCQSCFRPMSITLTFLNDLNVIVILGSHPYWYCLYSNFFFLFLSTTWQQNDRMSHRKSKTWKPLAINIGKFSALRPRTPVYLISSVTSLHFKSSGYGGQSLQMSVM